MPSKESADYSVSFVAKTVEAAQHRHRTFLCQIAMQPRAPLQHGLQRIHMGLASRARANQTCVLNIAFSCLFAGPSPTASPKKNLLFDGRNAVFPTLRRTVQEPHYGKACLLFNGLSREAKAQSRRLLNAGSRLPIPLARDPYPPKDRSRCLCVANNSS